jgi:lipopolysaccharide transport system ATP-binding protein
MSTVISVEHVTKLYRLGLIGSATVQEDLARWWAKWRGKPDPNLKIGSGDSARSSGQSFWALRDVSFDVKDGEALGIIGRNGAGKSTLLKILAQVTAPTSGQIRTRGRIASLLEVGTGFHPELTGRENIFLNGAILGMTKQEIRRKLDEIIAFADIDAFVDTPVKRYSSGMYVRLAFAVAAHLEPEILVIDEVLAVGDAAFQKKCLGKMGEAAKGGRTVLFVSHNMQAVIGLCNRAVWLDGGRVIDTGSPPAIIGRYLQEATLSGTSAREQAWADPQTAPGNSQIRLRSIRLIAAADDPLQQIHLETPFSIEVEYWNLEPEKKVIVNLAIYSVDGTDVLEDWSAEEATWRGRAFPTGLFRTVCHIPGNLLNEGSYRVRLVFFDLESTQHLYDQKEALVFSVTDVQERPVTWYGRFIGFVHPRLDWTTELVERLPQAPASLADVKSLPSRPT